MNITRQSCAAATLLLAVALLLAAPAGAAQSALVNPRSDGHGLWVMDPGPRTVGWSFRPEKDVWVTDLGFVDVQGEGLGASHDVGIWDAGGQLLTSATVPAGDQTSLVDGYRYTPVQATRLLAGQTYIIGATTCEDYRIDYVSCYPVSMSSLLPLVDELGLPDSLTGPHDPCTDESITLFGGYEFAYGLDLTYPDQNGYGEAARLESAMVPFGMAKICVVTHDYVCLAPNFRFVPEPATLLVVSVGFGILGFVRRRRRLQ